MSCRVRHVLGRINCFTFLTDCVMGLISLFLSDAERRLEVLPCPQLHAITILLGLRRMDMPELFECVKFSMDITVASSSSKNIKGQYMSMWGTLCVVPTFPYISKGTKNGNMLTTSLIPSQEPPRKHDYCRIFQATTFLITMLIVCILVYTMLINPSHFM